MKNTLQKIKNELASYAIGERWFIFFACACSFFITMEASIVKAVSNSIFLSSYTVKALPYVWIAIVPFNFLLVHLYNKLVVLIGPMKVQIYFMVCAAMMSLIGAFYLEKISFMPFLLYMWKDVYILLMFQQLWSVIHATIRLKKATYLYGMMFGVGGIGSAFGSIVPGFFAVKYGSSHLLLSTLPIYGILGLCYSFLLKARHKSHADQPISFSSKQSSFSEGVSLILSSSYLKYILALVVLMQVVSTLLDFNFNTYLQQIYTSRDARTEFLGRLFGSINTIVILLQFIGSYTLIRLFGMAKAHLMTPMYLLIVMGLFMGFPVFSLIVLAFASAKCLDYSIFGVLKEMLYIPLKTDEKFKAKAVIDVFAYRTSKALVSFTIIFFQMFFINQLVPFVSAIVILLCLIWGYLIVSVFNKHKKYFEPDFASNKS